MPKVNAEYELTRRQQIVEAAARCFTRTGYDATSIDDVCREAGLSKGGLYTYFKSKEQLFATVCHDHWAAGFQRAMDGLADRPTIEAKLEALGDSAFGRLGGDREQLLQTARMSLSVWGEAVHNEETRALTSSGYEAWNTQLQDLIREGQQTGELDPELDPRMAAVAIMAMFDGFQLYVAVKGEPLDVGSFQETFMRIVRGGILAK